MSDWQGPISDRISIVAVGCHCGAKPGEPCIGTYGNRWRSGLHADRRNAASEWKKVHPAVVEKLRNQFSGIYGLSGC